MNWKLPKAPAHDPYKVLGSTVFLSINFKSTINSFVKNSQKVIKSGDEYAVDLYNQYNQTLMTSFDFSDEELNSILTYIKSESSKEIQVAVVEGVDQVNAIVGCSTD